MFVILLLITLNIYKKFNFNILIANNIYMGAELDSILPNFSINHIKVYRKKWYLPNTSLIIVLIFSSGTVFLHRNST